MHTFAPLRSHIGRFLILAGLCGITAAPSPPPCSDDPRHRAFDFWIGKWDVHSSSNDYLGSNDITSEQDGCVLVEQWRGREGGTGMSINYFDPRSSSWRQHWVAEAGYLVELTGGPVDGAMVLEGSLISPDGDVQPMRGTWIRLEDGRVRQHFEVADSTDEWSTWFDGYYTRAADR